MSQSAISAATAAAVAADNKNDGVGYYQSAVSLGLMEVVFVNGLGVPSQVILRSVQLRTYHTLRSKIYCKNGKLLKLKKQRKQLNQK